LLGQQNQDDADQILMVEATAHRGEKTEAILYGLDEHDNVYYGRYYRPSKDEEKKIEWTLIPGNVAKANHIVAGPEGQLYILKNDGSIVRRSGIWADEPWGKTWQSFSVPSQLSMFAAGKKAVIALVSKPQKIVTTKVTSDKPWLWKAQKWVTHDLKGSKCYSIASGLTTDDLFYLSDVQVGNKKKPTIFGSKHIKVRQDQQDRVIWENISPEPPSKSKQIAVGVDGLFAVTKDNKVYFLDRREKSPVWIDIETKNKVQPQDTTKIFEPFKDPVLVTGLKEYTKLGLVQDIWLFDKKTQRIWHRHELDEKPEHRLGTRWDCPYDYAKQTGDQKIMFKEIAVGKIPMVKVQ
jgi:hypothetical protein